MKFGNGKKPTQSVIPDRTIPPVQDPESYGDRNMQEPHDYRDENPAFQADMKRLEYSISTDRLAEIAMLMNALTYGEMMQLADEIKRVDPENQVIKPDSTFAGVLHKWSEKKKSE